jgi:hypothetical protein
MEKPNIEKATKEQLIKYIEHLEGVLNGVSALEQQINRTCSLMAADMEKINNGKTDDLTILSLDDNILKKLMFTIKNKDFFMGKSNTSASPKSKKEAEPVAEEVKPIEITGNPFELISEKVKLNGKH